ncbi:MAG: diacylglycerol kinase family protein, partial [Bacteroidota bacterium]
MKLPNGLGQRIKSFGYAFQGVAELFGTQPNARIHLCVLVLVTVAGALLGLTTVEWMFIVLSSAAVLAAEAANTAIEYLTDLVSPDYHPLAGKAKDVAAASVLLMATGAAIIGVIIFLP